MKNRKELNLIIVDKLKAYLEQYPDMRFGQALRNLNLVDEVLTTLSDGNGFELYWKDEFNLEPSEILKRMPK